MISLRQTLPLALLFGAFLAFSAWSVYRAATDGSHISDPDYYDRGLSYDVSQDEAVAAAERGWHLSVQRIGQRLEIRLRDSELRPVEHALGTVVLSPNPQLRALTAEPEGLYTYTLPDVATGALPARVEFTRDGARLRRQLLLQP